MRCGTKAAGGDDVDYYRSYGVALKYLFTGNDFNFPQAGKPKWR